MTQVSFTFTVVLTNNPCVGGFAGIPADSALDKTMTAYIDGLILFTGIINGECDFSYDLLNDPALSPADPTIFTITQPTLTSVPGAMDPRIKSVADSGNLKVTATNAHAGVYKLLLRINSDKSPYDIAERYIRFTVTIREWRCTPKITAPILHDQYSFKIQKGSKAHNIEFTGLSNGDCLFSTQLVLPTLSFSRVEVARIYMK